MSAPSRPGDGAPRPTDPTRRPGDVGPGQGMAGAGVPAVVGLTDGRAIHGMLADFRPDATEFVVWLGSTDREVDAFSRRVLVPADRTVYVGFCKRPGESVRAPHDLTLEPLRVHVSRERHIDVRMPPNVEGSRSMVAWPLEADSQFRELFFLRDNVLGLERLEQLGAILLSMGVVSRENIDRALAQQNELRHQSLARRTATSPPATPAPPPEEGLRLGEVMRGMDLITEAQLAQALAAKFRLPFVDLDAINIDPAAAAEVPRELIARYGVLPTAVDSRTLTLAVREPMAPENRNLLEFRIGRRVREVIVAPSQLARHAEAHIAKPVAEAKPEASRPPAPPPPQEDFEQILRELGALPPEEEESAGGAEPPEVADNVIVRLVHRIFSDAYRRGASDIHVEPNGPEDNTIVRFRVDGDCVVYRELPPASRRALVARMKILAGLDIAERRKPQDGKIKLRLSGQPVELRLATFPTSRGDEDAVLRILASSKPLPLGQMGLSPRNHREVARILARPYGLILCVGPTGSGKTTTLHSMLGAINTPDMKIWTAEDPVEITQAGLRQMQVNVRAGLTFAAAMRAFLRGDPDVIMVGEMRDEETASTAVEASLTGHLVLSTLHTNSAPETVTRLIDMGLDPFSFADALVGVLAQRLARALCKTCRERYPAPPDARAEIEQAMGAEALAERLNGAELTLWRAPGCAVCGNTGYKGRVALHELMVTDPTLKRVIARKSPVDEIREAAMAAGMTTLLQDGVEKCLAGLTDLRQVLAVCSG